MTVPDVGYRVPEAQGLYDVYTIDEYMVFIDKNAIVIGDRVEFVATTILFMTNLDVIGINIIR